MLHDGQFLQSCSEGLWKYLHLKFPQCRLLGHWSSWVCLKIACPRPIGCVGFGETNSHYLWEHNMGMYQSPTKTVKHKFSTFWGCDRDPNRLGALHGKILGGTPQNGHLFWRGGKSLICRYPLIKEYGNRNMQNPPCDRYFSQNMQLSLAMLTTRGQASCRICGFSFSRSSDQNVYGGFTNEESLWRVHQ